LLGLVRELTSSHLAGKIGHRRDEPAELQVESFGSIGIE